MDYKLISGSFEAQGRRDTMEDTHKHIDEINSEQGFENLHKKFKHIAYYGVYDGHGGKQTAAMVEEQLHKKILNSDEFQKDDILGAFNSGYREMDKIVVDEANKHNWMNGSTCVTGIIADGNLYIANIGDSEAILISVQSEEITATNLTIPHKATDPSEKERIEKLGGHVFFGRVFGALAVSRSFGDAKYKQPKTSKDFVTWEPSTHVEKLHPNHKYIVLACDGLWDVMTHQDVAQLTHKSFQEGQDSESVAKTLVRTALNKRTEDNVTVIVVKIEWNNEQKNDTEKKEDHQKREDHDEKMTSTEEISSDKKSSEEIEKGNSKDTPPENHINL